MRTQKYISRTIGFIKKLSLTPKENTTPSLELTNTGFGINLKKTSTPKRTPGSLLGLMYCEENNILFI